MNGEGTTSTGTGTTLFLALHHSFFFWALLLVGLVYGIFALTGQPVVRKVASFGMALLLLGTFTELGIAILWRLFFGNFEDVPNFEFSAFTLAYALPALALVWPWRATENETSMTAPPFDWLRAAWGAFCGVVFTLLVAYGDTAFRVYRGDAFLLFRGFAYYFFELRGIWGACMAGLLLAALAGFLPRFQRAHAQLTKQRGATASGTILLLALLIRLAGGSIVG